VAYYAPAPQVPYYAPQAAYYAAPAPCTSCYQPVVAARAVYGRPGYSIFGAPRFYVPGEPARNVLRAVTP
jgi:hypothetical protein